MAECGKILASPVLARHIIQAEIPRLIPADLFQKVFAFSEALQDLFISVLSNDRKIVKVIFTALRIASGKCVHFQLFRIVIFLLVFPHHHPRQETIHSIIKNPFCHEERRTVRRKVTLKRPISEIPVCPVHKKTHDHLHQHAFSAAVAQGDQRILPAEIKGFVVDLYGIIVVVQV